MKKLLFLLFLVSPIIGYSQSVDVYIGLTRTELESTVYRECGQIPHYSDFKTKEGHFRSLEWTVPSNLFRCVCFLSWETNLVSWVTIIPPNNEAYMKYYNTLNERTIKNGHNTWIIDRGSDSLFIELHPTGKSDPVYGFTILPYSP